MSADGAFVVLGSPADAETSPLAACLAARPRTAQAQWTTAAPPAADVRALVLLDAGDDPAATAALITELRDRETPVLAAGHGAAVLAAALGGRTPPDPPAGPFELARIRRTGDAEEPVTSDLVDGSVWLVAGPDGAEVPDGATVLATFDNDAAAAYTPWPGCVAMSARVDVPAAAAVELVDDADLLAGSEPFFDAWATALTGRWVDEVVGRTEDEAPWGRRGPPPVRDEALFLGARAEQGWSVPARG